MRIHHAAAIAAILALLAACEKSEPPDVIVMDVPGATPPAAAPAAPVAETPAMAEAPAPAAVPPAATPAPPAATPAPKAGATATPPAKTATPATPPAKAPATPAVKTAASAPAEPAAPAADLANGQAKFAMCRSCHAAGGALGPSLAGVVGRRAGTAAGYEYSDALRTSGIVWTEANLDRWLTRPAAMVPGTKMLLPVANAKDRTDIIAYLKTQ